MVAFRRFALSTLAKGDIVVASRETSSWTDGLKEKHS